MSRILLAVLAALFAVLGGMYQITIRPKLILHGQGRVVEAINNKKCTAYPELQACEKLSIFEPNGHVYLACSTPESRRHWLPPTMRFNSTGKSVFDYVAVYNPDTRKIKKLQMEGHKFPRGVSVHGMDVAPSQEHPGEVLIYLVNHRQPLDPEIKAADVGADSVVELFSAPVGGKVMEYVTTFKSDIISTPNDISAVGDDQSFYFTNDHGSIKTGWERANYLDTFLDRPWANVGFCNAKGCQIAAENVLGANGITRGKDGLYYVGSSTHGVVYVMERQQDNNLALLDVIKLDRPVDNLSVDKTGAIWAAGLVDSLKLTKEHFENSSIKCPSSALRITPNTKQSQYYGEKYKIEKMFEDDGSIASGSTTAAYDPERKKLYLTGCASPAFTVCDLS